MTDKIKKNGKRGAGCQIELCGSWYRSREILKAFCFLTTDKFRDSGYMLHMHGITLCGKATKEKKNTAFSTLLAVDKWKCT